MLELNTNTLKIKYHLASDVLSSIKMAGDYSKFHQAFKPVVFTVKDTNKDEDPCFVDTFTKEVIKGVHYASVSFADVVFEDENPEEWVWLNYELYYNDKFEIKLFERQGDSLYITRENLNNKQYPLDTLFKLYNLACEDDEGLPHISQAMLKSIKMHVNTKLATHRINYGAWKVNVHYKTIVDSYKPVSELLTVNLQREGFTDYFTVRISGDNTERKNRLVNMVYKCFARELTNNMPITLTRKRVQKSFGEQCDVYAYGITMMEYASLKAQLFMMKVLNDRFILFISKEKKLILMDIDSDNHYSFTVDSVWVEPEDIKNAIEDHLDYLNEHQYLENIIPEGAYATLMSVYDALVKNQRVDLYTQISSLIQKEHKKHCNNKEELSGYELQQRFAKDYRGKEYKTFYFKKEQSEN